MADIRTRAGRPTGNLTLHCGDWRMLGLLVTMRLARDTYTSVNLEENKKRPLFKEAQKPLERAHISLLPGVNTFVTQPHHIKLQ